MPLSAGNPDRRPRRLSCTAGRTIVPATYTPVVHTVDAMRTIQPVYRIGLALAFAVTSALAMTSGARAATTVECGPVTGYAAPDPGGPSVGSLAIGLVDVWSIAPDAVISANVAVGLPGIVNAAPTCLSVTADVGGVVSALDFADAGRIAGMVTFDAGNDAYIFADRLFVPSDVIDAYPGLAALFPPSAAAGTQLVVDFSVDPTSGMLLGFDGRAAFCGAGTVTSDGDGQVGEAVIPAEVLDAEDLAALADAGSQEACAAIRSIGTIDTGTGQLAITTTVDISVAAEPTPTPTRRARAVVVTPPPTSTEDPHIASAGIGAAALTVGLMLIAAGAIVSLVAQPRRKTVP